VKLGWRAIVLFAFYAVVTVFVVSRAPFPQPAYYHDFADKRTLWSIANFFNVASNAAFLIPGVAGLWLCARRPPSGARWAWTTLFGGVTAVAIGSSYYHFAPADGPLFWDRLPMTVGFTALLVALIDEYLAERAERALLVPIVAVGVVSLLYWVVFDDLRAYFWIQAIALATALWIPAVYPDTNGARKYLLAAVLAYVAAVLSEQADWMLWALLENGLSGHTIKHLLAALGLYQLFRMLRDRAPP
jgi:hypothetical protein